MTDATSQMQRITADEEAYFRRFWPRPRRSRRLVLITILAGLALILFGVVAFWQIRQVFALIEQQREHQRLASDIIRSMSELDSLLTRNNSDAINAIHAIDERASDADIEDLQAKQVQNRHDLADGLALLRASLVAYGEPGYLQDVEGMRKMVQELALAREQMVASYRQTHDLQTYMKLRDQMQAKRVILTQYIFQMRSRMNPAIDASQKVIDREMNRAFFVSSAALAISGAFIFALGWMLVRYVDKREQVEADLRNATEMWIGIINALKQGVAVFDYDQRLLLWNPRYAELQGIEPDKLHIGMLAMEVRQHSVKRDSVPLEVATQRFAANLARVRQGERFEREVVRGDGRRILVGFHPMDDQFFLVTQTDMTQIRQAEQLARDQAVRLATIMDNVPDAIVVINDSGSIESWNAAAERVFGYQATEIIHRNVGVLMPEPHAGQHDFYLRRYLTQGDKSGLNRLREFTARRQDGTEFPIDLRISEMRLGSKRMFTGIIRDITERRAVEQMKNEFISTVNHELRTPLTSIIGSLTLLVDGVAGQLPEKAQRLIGMAEKNSQRLGRLINDILDLEKAEAGRMTLNLKVLGLEALLQHSLELNHSYAARFNVTLRLQCNAPQVSVRGDEARLLQVMSNLLSNAIKHSPPQSQVLVDVGLDNGVVRVTVHDAGPGIAEEFKGRMFQRFAQADTSDARREPGTGLGLAITKQLVEQHGGHIGFVSGQSLTGDGRGASFWFELPVARTSGVAGNTGPLNLEVLLCEDDPDVAQLLIEMLQLEGCSVRHTGVSSGVRPLLAAQPAILIVDIDLPDQDGLTLVAELRREEQWRSLPVVVVSGRPLTGEARAAHAGLQVSAWVDKPVDRMALRSALIQAGT